VPVPFWTPPLVVVENTVKLVLKEVATLVAVRQLEAPIPDA
jgi:hypothetical protein